MHKVKISDPLAFCQTGVRKYKQMIKDPFYDEKVLILLPDLLTCSDLPIIYGMVKKEMDQNDSDPYSSNLTVYIARGGDSVS